MGVCPYRPKAISYQFLVYWICVVSKIYCWYYANKYFMGAKMNGVETSETSFNTNLSGKFHTVCPLCGSQELKRKYEVREYILTECLNCSAIFIRNIITHKYLEEFYQNHEEYCFYEDDNSDCLNYYNLKLKNEIENLKPEKGSILDVGCSSGLFLNQMPGWERHGVEVSVKYGEMAKDRIRKKKPRNFPAVSRDSKKARTSRLC